VRPVPPDEPKFLVDKLVINPEIWSYNAKVPNNNHNTSWAPRIWVDTYFGGDLKPRWKVEYFMPDGSLWFSEPLDFRPNIDHSASLSRFMSPDDSNRDKKAIVTGGSFGLKITDTRAETTVFQGKFTIVRYKPKDSDPQYKNEVDYYVDNDWRLPIALADLDWATDHATPEIRMWFKGDLKNDSFEARLLKDGKQIASTDDAPGGINTGERFWAEKQEKDPALFWHEFIFSWPSRIEFLRTGDGLNQTEFGSTTWINQKPGQYTVKIFYDGEQVRETQFTIGPDGTYANTGIAGKAGLSTNTVILPVKVTGTKEKWNPVNAKALGFYGAQLPLP